jgi:tetratricopeptide (TPR) repeat protein
MSSGPTGRRTIYSALLLALLANAVQDAAQAQGSWDFIPTAEEYQAWPEYCRVQFTLHGQVASVIGGIQFPASTIASWRSAVGQPFEGLHHYCASIHFLNRSRAASDLNEKRFLLNRAWSDVNYSIVRADIGSMVFPNMAVVASQIKLEQGDGEGAISILKQAITAQPAQLETHIALALVQRKLGRLNLARDTLREADRISNGESIEVQYNLGLINLDLGDSLAAVENAKKAYAKGYPLPGLRRRLAQAGHKIPAGE